MGGHHHRAAGLEGRVFIDLGQKVDFGAIVEPGIALKRP